MSSTQKVIKYCAIGFAIMLAIGIISGIAHAVFAVVSITSVKNAIHSDVKTIDFNETFTEVTSLNVENSTGELKIMIGETFQVEAENVSEGFEATVDGSGELSITENDNGVNFFGFNFEGFNSPNSKITLYIPADFVAEEVKIDTGAGEVSLEGLETEYLYISAGAGNINGKNIVADKVKIDGGVGNVKFNDVYLTDADFDCGVGNLTIDGVLVGENKFDCGVGEVKLDLVGDVDDYDLNIDAGVGTIRLNGDKIDGTKRRNNSADNSIRVDGGVGNVKIDIKE